jgi:integrase
VAAYRRKSSVEKVVEQRGIEPLIIGHTAQHPVTGRHDKNSRQSLTSRRSFVARRDRALHTVASKRNLFGTYGAMTRGKTTRRIRFTDRALKAIKPPPRPLQLDYFDDSLPGFGMRVSYNGRKSWIAVYRVNGQKGRLTIGRADLMPLADAREEARQALKEASKGIDPGASKKQSREAPTFEQIAARYVAEYAKVEKVTWRKDERLLTRNLVPTLGTKKAQAITSAEIKAELSKIKARPAPVEANRTLEVVRKLYGWAVEQEIVTTNPAAAIKKPTEEKSRDRVLTPDELQILWLALDAAPLLVRSAFRTMFLAVQRRGEVQRMRWPDLDRREGWWNIPAELTKTKTAYRVPITPAMSAILDEIEQAKLDPLWVFPAASGKTFIPETNLTRPFRQIVKDAGIVGFRAHDILHTCTSMMAARGISEFDIGKVRHHAMAGDKKTSSARYNHYRYDAEKRRTLDLWDARLFEIVNGKRTGSNVIELARA